MTQAFALLLLLGAGLGVGWWCATRHYRSGGQPGASAELRDTLGALARQLRELELARVGAYADLSAQARHLAAGTAAMGAQTTALATALAKPQARGRWGELQLRRIVDLAGMSERCDFREQPAHATDDGLLRPDLVVQLAGGRNLVVDSKVSLAAYLEAAQSTDRDWVEQRLLAHSRSLRRHVETLASKAYWSALTPAPEFVVLFIPGEPMLGAALERDPELLDDAARCRVVLATPTTLIATLRTCAYAWQQDAVGAAAQRVLDTGKELHDRLGTVLEHVDRLGRALSSSVARYNDTVGSLESRVLVSARRLTALGLVDDPLTAPEPLITGVRPLLTASPDRWPDDDEDATRGGRASSPGARVSAPRRVSTIHEGADRALGS